MKILFLLTLIFCILILYFITYVVNKENYENINSSFQSEITVIVKTVLRPKCLERLVKSIRKFYQNIPIVIVDDSPDANEEIVKYNNIVYKQLPFDSGVSKGRNEAVKLANTKYILLVDDDFVFTKESNIFSFYDFLEKNRNYDVVCGAVDDRDLYSGVFYNTKNGVEIKSIDEKNNKEKIIDTERGLNFFLTKKETLMDVPWDENLKTEEHSEHFYRFKLFGKKIAIMPDVIVHHDGGRECDSKNKKDNYRVLRNRNFKNFIFLKYNIQEFCGTKMSDKQKRFHTALADANILLKDFPFVISCGTALGFYREGGFIEWDNDIDLFLDDYYKIHDIVKIMEPAFTLVQRYPTELTFKHKETGTLLDIFFTKNIKDNLQYSVYYKNKEVKFKVPQYIPEKIVIFGKTYNIIPKNILQYIYGENWSVPREYSFSQYMNSPTGFLYLDDSPVPMIDSTFFNTFFGDNIFVINMKNRPDKMQKVSKELQKLNINFKRFEGVKGEKICAKLSAGEIGCSKSHQEIWKTIYNSPTEWGLVIEDDIVIPDEIEIEDFAYSMLEALCGNNPADLVYFGSCFSGGSNRPSIFPSSKIYLKNGHASCTHFYAINKRAIEKLLPLVKNNNSCKEPIDTTIDNFYKDNSGAVCVFSKKKYTDKPEYYGEGIVLQLRDSPSDVLNRSSDKTKGRK